MDFFELASALGPAAGAVIAVALLVRYMREKDHRLITLITNHLSQTYDQHEKMTRVLEAMRDLLLRLAGKDG